MVTEREFLFILTYAAVLTVFTYLVARYALRRGWLHKAVGREGRASTLSRVKFIVVVSLAIMRNALTLLIASSIVLAAMAAAYSATSETGYVSVRMPSAEGGTGYAVLFRFKHLIPLREAKSIVKAALTASAGQQTSLGEHPHIGWAAYHMLSSPVRMVVHGEPRNIYVLVGLPKDIIAKAFRGSAVLRAELIYGATALKPYGLVRALLKLPNATRIKALVAVVDPATVENARLVDGIPLLPIQSYLGSEPVETPPKYVLIGGLSFINSLLGISPDLVNIAYMKLPGVAGPEEALKMWRVAGAYVSTLTVVGGGRAVVVSGTQVPTTKSLATAAVSTAIACILCLSVAASLVPRLRNLYGKLSLIGMPSWSVGIINTIYTSSTVLIPGLAATVASYAFLGGVSALNSLLTTLATWAVFTTYVCRKSGVRRLASDVYVYPAQRYVILIATTDLRSVVAEVRASIEGNEFFDVEEIEERVFEGGEAALRARLVYRETWGVGLDVEVLASVEGGHTHISIYSNVWGIEEISSALMRDVLALALSRIVGRLRAWEQPRTYS